jgi:hypothetical protein
VVTLNALRIGVSNHYAIAMRGKQGPRAKDINGGFIETQAMSPLMVMFKLVDWISSITNSTSLQSGLANIESSVYNMYIANPL